MGILNNYRFGDRVFLASNDKIKLYRCMNIKFSFMGGCFLVSMKFGRIIMAGGLNFFLFVLVIWFPDIIRIALAFGVIVVVV